MTTLYFGEKQDVRKLYKAIASVNPSTPNMWAVVASQIEGKSAEECFNKYWERHPTPKKGILEYFFLFKIHTHVRRVVIARAFLKIYKHILFLIIENAHQDQQSPEQHLLFYPIWIKGDAN